MQSQIKGETCNQKIVDLLIHQANRDYGNGINVGMLLEAKKNF